jgi:hypothetical protein
LVFERKIKVGEKKNCEFLERGFFNSIPESGSFRKKFMAYVGPGLLVAVGYMDPGNWATDIAGGAQFGYTLCL